MIYIKILFPGLMILSSFTYCQNIKSYTSIENNYLNVFNKFKIHLSESIKERTNIDDSSELKFILLNYIFTNNKLDSVDKNHFKKGELDDNQFKECKSEINAFYRFFSEREIDNVLDNLTAMPIRLGKNNCIYNMLSDFQQQNTFIYFDKRYPDKILGYMLFIPKIDKSVSQPRIWSWTLIYKFGAFRFKAVTGEEGLEYFVSEGVKGPNQAIMKK